MPTKLLIVIFVVCTAASQLLIKRAVGEIGAPEGLGAMPRFLGAAAVSAWVYVALVLQVAGYVTWMVVLAHEKLGVAVALAGSAFYVLMAALAWALHGEALTLPQWAGIGFITVGVACIILGQG